MSFSTYKNAWRISEEASFNEANPESKEYEDLPVIRESEGLQPKQAVIYPETAAGKRAMNTASPIAGADEPELGSLEHVFYPDLMLPILKGVFGSQVATPTAGTAALAATVFNGMSAQALDTEPTSTERLVFTIASSTDATGATIQIFENAILVETITIADSVSSVDGSFNSLGSYSAPVTITTTGTITAGTLAIAGVASTSYVFNVTDTLVSFAIEQQARPEASPDTNSEFFPGCVFPSIEINFDRSDTAGILAITTEVSGLFPTVAVSTVFDDAASIFFKPFAAWHATIQIDDVDFCDVESATITLTPNTNLYAVACGSKKPDQARLGFFEVTGTLTVIPSDDARWLQYLNVAESKLNIIFTSTELVTAATPYSMDIEVPQFSLEDYSRAAGNELNMAELAFRGVYDAGASGSANVTVVAA